MGWFGYVPESEVLVLREEREGALHQAARDRAALRHAEERLKRSVEAARIELDEVRVRSHEYA